MDTLNKDHLIAHLKKCEFGKDSWVYLERVIGRGEKKVDLANIESINRLPTPTNVVEVRNLMEETKHLRNLFQFF